MNNQESPSPEDDRITYLLSSIYGFGHTSRASAIAGLIHDNYGLDFYVKNPEAKDYLLQNLDNSADVSFKSADYEKEMSDDEYLSRNADSLIPMINNSRFVISDFLMQGKAVSFLSGLSKSKPKTVGIYHSLTGYDTDDPEVELFKTTFLEIASELDIMFLAELNPRDARTDSYQMDSGTLIVPTGPVVRGVTKSPVEVKNEIGLSHDDEFIYVQGGGLTNGERLDSVVRSLSSYSMQGMKLVINDRDCVGISNGDVIYVRSSPDGHNMINAAAGVISKPGMGVVSETIATRTPLFLIDYPTPESRAKYDMLAPLVGNFQHRYESAKELVPQIKEWIKVWSQMRLAFGEVACDGAEIVAEYLKKQKP